MNTKKIVCWLTVCWWAGVQISYASSFLLNNTDQLINKSAAIFRGNVVDLEAYRGSDGGIYTRVIFRVNEVFKGKLPFYVQVTHRGGVLGREGEADGFAPAFKLGEERLLFVSRRQDGSLFASQGQASALALVTNGLNLDSSFAAGQETLQTLRNKIGKNPLPGADVSDQAAVPLAKAGGAATAGNPTSTATNLLVGTDGIPARFLLPDRGESIPYLIDADYLPAGMTQTQAVNAVQTALAAWTNVTSVRYVFAGIQSFGQASANVSANDGVLRIQVHDHYNYIGGGGGSGDTLGQGGHAWTILNLTPGWSTGGNVNGNDFHKVTRGYVVLSHTNTFMQNITNFAEVLCHEIGHTIGLGHSSQNASEPNPILKQAIMYYSAHGNGRGATLNSFDINTSRQIHPQTNTPPYVYDRVMDVTTTPSPISIPGVNMVQLRGYDLQNDTLTLATTDASGGAGTFSVLNNVLTFVPNAFFSAARVDPAGNSFYDIIYARYSDGVNASPFARIRVISLNPDNFLEGIPDNWRTTYFGSSDPNVGANHHANDDADGDSYSNLQEYLLGSDPTSKASNLRISSFTPTVIQWQAKAYEVYEIYSSTDLATWNRAINPVVPTNSLGSATEFTNGSPKQFFRIEKVP